MKSWREEKSYWIYGKHAVKAALENPHRICHDLWISPEVYASFEKFLHHKASKNLSGCKIHEKTRDAISQKLGEGILHQGCALRVEPLPNQNLETLSQGPGAPSLLVALDQVTDPHNVGAILRSCAAFGAGGLIFPAHHAPAENNGVLSKVASGATEHVPLLMVPNLARALENLKKNLYWCIGLDESGPEMLSKITARDGKIVLVLGSEGRGLRPLIRKTCDFLVRLETCPQFSTLNVSTTAAITLHHFSSYGIHKDQ